MLAIRLKRVGRSNLAQYRLIVQDSHRHPKRGAVVEYLGTYDPHKKTIEFDKERVQYFLNNGAQPSNTVAMLLKANGVKLPKWVNIEKNPKRETRNPEKLRKNQPKDAKSEEKPAEEPKAEESADVKADEAPKEEPAKDGKEDAAEAKPEKEAESKEPSKEEKESKPEEKPADKAEDSEPKEEDKKE